MSQELHYTSVPRGLKPGSRGFCTVGLTAHMPGTLVDRLEALSGYQPVFPPHDPSAPLNPIVFSHLRLTVSGKAVSVLSRIGPAGLDYSGRPNKYAHHVVLEGAERPESGPAWLLSQPGFMQDVWEGEPRETPAGRTPPLGDCQPGMARAWQALTGDGGWAGVLAESFLADSRRMVYLVFRPGMDLLPLFVEALALLPASRRWDVDFSTYFNQLPQGVTCAWRGVLEGSSDAKNARQLRNARVLDLCQGLAPAEGGVLVHLARTLDQILQERVATTTSPASGRHIPRMPAEPVASNAGLASSTGAFRPWPATASYELIPELAKLVPGARLHLDTEDTKTTAHKHRWGLAALVIAACLIPMSLAPFLLNSSTALKALGFNSESRREIAEAQEHVIEVKKDVDAEAAKKIEISKIEQPKPAENKSTRPDATKTQPDATKAAQGKGAGSSTGSSEPIAGSKASPDPIVTPLFLPLDEPVSYFGGEDKQKPLSLDDPSLQRAKMELLGADPDLRFELTTGPNGMPKLVVFAPPKNVYLGSRTEVATFETVPERKIAFRWDQNLQQRGLRRRLRDCVLKVITDTNKTHFCILRSKAPEPKDIYEFSHGKTQKRFDALTRYKYEWDSGRDENNSFANASGTISIERCKLLNNGGKETVPLAREGPSWVYQSELAPLFSAKLDKSSIVIELHDNEPASLPNRIERKQSDIQNLRNVESASRDPNRKREFSSRIRDSEAELKRLKVLQDIDRSSLDLTITWELAGMKFKIWHVGSDPSIPSTVPPN